MKKILFLYYSQTGQTREALTQLAGGMAPHAECDFKIFSVEEKIPFPWGFASFFRAFPRCVLGLAPRLAPLEIDFSSYDLIVLGGQVWFLSPSLPLQSFLQSEKARELRGKKVVTVLTCRNLWYSAARIVREKLLGLGSDVKGQIILCERSPLWASFVTTPRWMLTGKKEAFSIFPEAGIEKKEFLGMKTLGETLVQNWGVPLNTTNLDRLSLRWMDEIGRPFFEFWAGFIHAVAPQAGWVQDLMLAVFRVNLVLLILLLLPTTKVLEVLLSHKSKSAKGSS